jgi:hypothetical protein
MTKKGSRMQCIPLFYHFSYKAFGLFLSKNPVA